MFYTYVLESEVDQSYYIGSTANIEKRLEKHNTGKSRFTSKKMPWKVVYYETFATRSEAIVREKYLKSLKSHTAINKLINGPVV